MRLFEWSSSLDACGRRRVQPRRTQRPDDEMYYTTEPSAQAPLFKSGTIRWKNQLPRCCPQNLLLAASSSSCSVLSLGLLRILTEVVGHV